jgi:anti-sigma-K factor RskA
MLLAGEYVLGTLDARAARQFEHDMQGDSDLRAMVAAWEYRLAPLSALATPEAPPPELWARIEAAIHPQPVSAKAKTSRFWQGWAIGATALAAAFAAVAFLPADTQPRMMTVLVSDPGQSAWTAEIEPSGGIRLAAISAPSGKSANAVPDGKILQLWGLAPGGTVPVSLGLLPHGAGTLRIPVPAMRPVRGMQILISLEPESPNGIAGTAPTGPVVFVGRLSEPGPNT